MSQLSEPSGQPVNGISDDERPGLIDEDPATPRDDESIAASSQQTIPSTEAPNSPAADPSSSFKTELNDDRAASVIPSSLTPPPSSQVPLVAGAGIINPLGYGAPHPIGIFSPPATGLNGLGRDVMTTEYIPPTPQQIADAAAEELRAMLRACVAEHAKLKMEAAHHKLQYSLLSLQAEEDAKRAAVEHEMAKKEVDALRMAEHSRQARQDLTAASETSHAKYHQLKICYEEAVAENEDLRAKYKAARKVIQQKTTEIFALKDEQGMLLNRIRENRDHMHHFCSPGGIFHGASTPKTQTASPAQHKATPRQTPRSSTNREAPRDGEQNFMALLQALNQENNSAPSTPLPGHRSVSRAPSKHTRNVQSMSSLPTTPIGRSRPDGGLLPSADLVPQTEPPYRASRFMTDIPMAGKSSERRKSRESTISAEDNEELARQALQSVAAAASVSYASHGSHRSARRRSEEEEEVFESQASQAASEMLRRDPRESFEVASSVNSRDGTPAPADKSAKTQARLFGGLNKSGIIGSEKRKFSGHGETREEMAMRDPMMSPTKKLRVVGGLRDPDRVGLGIRYGLERHEAGFAVLAKAPTDVVILSSLRTPICRSYKGQLRDAYPEELLSVVLRATLDAHPDLDPARIDDVAVGVVLSELGGSKAARMAMNHVGFPSSTSLYTANRACASSLQSIALVAAQIRTQMVDVGIGAGMESMTRNYGSRAIPVDVWPALKSSEVKEARDCVMPMGLTSENVASRYGVSRGDQDRFAVESHLRAARAREQGWFKEEIVPVTTRWQEVDKEGNKVGEEKTITVTQDDGIRANASLEGLAKLKPAFKADGASTAGNSSQVSDGAAATLLMRRSTATALGLGDRIMGRFVGAAVAGCAPDEMGIGPALAIPKLLKQLGLETADVQRWEINEAFASQAIYCVRELGLEKAWEEGRVNPDGGAIALGHPLGATGARMVSTLMHGMKRNGDEVGVVSMCIGTGMGMSGLFVRE
ncbi:peroxisomal 3-ketoacyl-CoA thiolase 2 [Echria macrotheca]|uniref:acetyl-CoA C-acyltransferase n=1 Tax=Echria macrotheca TaxID=438768 RepID=A0AAJ0BA20_9PEZI|nr:peroxisomal 3-ketoacyl-CoA thiolase 2 [Echria macrotheca]